MGDMKFKFTIQPYQTEAVDSVVRVFAGQPKSGLALYRRDVPLFRNRARSGAGTITTDNGLHRSMVYGQSSMFDSASGDDLFTGYGNGAVRLDGNQILANIHRIQQENNIKQDNTLITGGLGACSLDVEMETGTGKTYVYIKTMFELNRHYGWTKFMVVVPSIAIREGVMKNFETTADHFMDTYGKKIRAFIYDSQNLTEVDEFSKSADIYCMIINMQAFNSSFNEAKSGEGRGGNQYARIIFSERDDFGSRRPIDVIAANHPIIILDEPQKMGGEKTQKALRQFHPLFCLNYSATHRQHHNLVYVLDALDAYNMKLVKKIEVKGIKVNKLQGTDGYLYLESIEISPKKPPMARLEYEVSHNKSIKREIHRVGVDDDLYVLSKNMEQYRGYHINEIDPLKNTLSFTNGEVLHVGEVSNDGNEEDLRRAQIRETIRSHFAKEKEMYDRGIKVLSLFFIDEVSKYRKYDENGEEVNSLYGTMFEEEYNHVLDEYLTLFSSPYEEYLKKIDVHKTHAGYFSIDKKGHKVDSKVKRGSDISDDESAYDLILKDKEKLLSLDNPVRFIFSHSALREGWDNPNVFQICALKHGGDSATQKRQEVGRGLRLCVNSRGDRMDRNVLGDRVQQVNVLTVIASEGYDTYVKGLQEGIRESLYERPTKATEEYFVGKTLMVNGVKMVISEKQGHDVYRYLIKHDYIDDNDKVTDKYREDAANNTLAPLPESCRAVAEGIHALVRNIYDEHALDGMISNGLDTKIRENSLNDNFYKKEFQTLWNYINHKYAYTVDFDSQELIKKAIAHVDDKLFVSHLQYTVTTGTQGTDWTMDKLKEGSGFMAEKSHTYDLKHSPVSHVSYDLVGEIAKGTKLTRRSAAAILSGISPKTFAMYKENPEEFIKKTILLINEEKASMIVEHISYNLTARTYDSAIFTAEKNRDFAKAYLAKKNVQDYVFTDGYAQNGESVERKFARDMDLADEVCVYAKLPKGFSIPTPVGNYSPDWAIAFKKGTVKHIFFIAETKGTMESLNLKPIEQAKISCARKLFSSLSSKDVVYHEVDSYQHLLDIMGKM